MWSCPLYQAEKQDVIKTYTSAFSSAKIRIFEKLQKSHKHSNGVPIARMRNFRETESNDSIISKYGIMYFEYTDGTGRIDR